MIVAIKDEVKDYRDNYHEAFKKFVNNNDDDVIAMVTITGTLI